MSSSRFDNLPNELIYEIFSYIDALELYRALFDLNSRINNILNSISNISFHPRSPANAIDPFVARFAQRVVYLNVPRPDYINVTRFANVRSLQLFDFLSEQQLKQIRHQNFVHLVCLRIPYVEDSAVSSAFYQMIFSNEFPSLCKCILDEITPPDLKYRWSGSPSLRSLTSNGFSLSVYFNILIACSNLIHLHSSAIRYTDDDDIQSPSVRHTHLRYLYIRTINIHTIESILSCVLNLERLHIISDWSRGNNCLPLNFAQLTRILIQWVPCLRRFDCDTMERNAISIDTIHEFHPCFRRIQCERVPDGRLRFYTLK